jgi:hypothetical protein
MRGRAETLFRDGSANSENLARNVGALQHPGQDVNLDRPLPRIEGAGEGAGSSSCVVVGKHCSVSGADEEASANRLSRIR